MNWYRLHQTAMDMPDSRPLVLFCAAMAVLAVAGSVWAGRDWWKQRGDEFVCHLLLWLIAITVSEYVVKVCADHSLSAMVAR